MKNLCKSLPCSNHCSCLVLCSQKEAFCRLQGFVHLDFPGFHQQKHQPQPTHPLLVACITEGTSLDAQGQKEKSLEIQHVSGKETFINSCFTAKDYKTYRIMAYHLQSSTFCSAHATWYDINGRSSSNQAGKHFHPSILYMEKKLTNCSSTKLEALRHF
jgi:hypothetical protein